LVLRFCGSSSKEESQEQLGTGREERELKNYREGPAELQQWRHRWLLLDGRGECVCYE
jgi:hypothetical protein